MTKEENSNEKGLIGIKREPERQSNTQEIVLKVEEDSFCSGNCFGISLDYLKVKCADFFFCGITYDLARYLI